MTAERARSLLTAVVGIALASVAGCSSVGDFEEEEDAGLPGVDAAMTVTMDAGPAPDASSDGGGGDPACAVLPPRLPEGRAGWSAASAPDGKIYLVGGTPDFGPEPRPSALFVFDPVTNSVRTLATAPVHFDENPGATFVGDRMMVVNTEVWFYDPASDAWSPGPATPGGAFMSRAVTTGTDGRVYVFGGTSLMGAYTTDAEVYDPATGAWQLLPPVPTAISGFGAVSISGRVYLVGKSTWIYVTGNGTWFQIATTEVLRRYPGVALQGADVLAIGGMANDGWTPLGSVERYPPMGGWASRARLPVPVGMAAAATSVSCPGRVYLFGGSAADGVTNAVQVYGPDDAWVLSP